MTTLEYIVSVLKLPFTDEEKAAMIVKLVDAGIKAGLPTVSGAALAPAQTLQAQPEPVPAAAPVPAPVIKPASGVTFSAEGGFRVDDVALKYTPGTVYMPVTGNVLSVAQPENGEMVMGYLNRIKRQLKATDLVDRTVFVLASGFAPTAQSAGLEVIPANWPAIADRVVNSELYQTKAQMDAAALARQQIVSGMQTLASSQGTAGSTAAPEPETVPVAFDNR